MDGYLGLYEHHVGAGRSKSEAMHLVVRNALISPRFRYRTMEDGPLDDVDLGIRLAYFLTGGPPDSALQAKVDSGSLNKPGVLRSQAEKLLPAKPGAALIRNFTGQWLDTRLLPDIMPDPKFKFILKDELAARDEVEYFFAEMLRENRPMTDFIDPNFTWTTSRMAKNIYGMKGVKGTKGDGIQRVTFPRGGRYGGVLGQSAVMMATANGVDTQPVLRGVWVLENILGMATPPPPKAVPALTPDTVGALTPRDLLAAHTTESSCAGCHRKIDPVGFVLENFDPVGRWRDEWPGIHVPIDAASTLPDGTEINDIIDLFSECLAEHLMTYATGRVPNYSERKEIAEIVARNHESGNGLRDLVLGLIESETFRTK
ncbi:MAG: hypothetical protein ACI97B_003167 [Verrucomicrobiales bacterium]